jgi:hypothetical protein
MADLKISQLTAITTLTPATDVLPVVDVTGTTKKITSNQILGAGGTATLASATISGDLTVNTNVLKVDSTNDRVGVKTATPAAALHVASGNIRLDDGFQLEFGGSTNSVAGSNATNTVQIYTNNVERYNINSTGVSTWSVGGSTAMTLNSTGLGVGTTDTTNGRLNIRAGTAATGNSAFFTNIDGTYNPYLQIQHSSSGIKLYTNSSFGGDAGNLTIGCGGATNALIVNGSGNVGVGVTPSAWGSNSKALQVGGGSASVSSTGAGSTASRFAHGAYFDNTNWLYQYTGVGPALYQVTGANAGSTHAWYTSAGGTAGNTITDFASPKMTLDASGNLVIGSAATGDRRLEVKSAGTSNTTFAAHFRDSADTLLFHVRSDGYFNTGQGTLSPYNNTTASAANMFVDSSGFVYRSTSSLKYKTDVKDSIHGLADVLKLRSVTYKAKNGDDTVFGGLIAEEVHAAGLTEFVAYAPDKTPDSINYGNMVALLVSAIKELTARVEALEA